MSLITITITLRVRSKEHSKCACNIVGFKNDLELETKYFLKFCCIIVVIQVLIFKFGLYFGKVSAVMGVGKDQRELHDPLSFKKLIRENMH